MKNPIAHWSQSTRSTYILYLAGLNSGIMWVMGQLDEKLQPHGIIALELAGSYEKVKAMLITWEQNHVINILFFSLGFDYLFMVAYSLGLWFLCMDVATTVKGRVQQGVLILAWLQPVAGLLDALENGSLYYLAIGTQDANVNLPAVAKYAAIVKFTIALTGLAVGILGEATRRLRTTKN